jgi:hypothetical protein
VNVADEVELDDINSLHYNDRRRSDWDNERATIMPSYDGPESIAERHEAMHQFHGTVSQLGNAVGLLTENLGRQNSNEAAMFRMGRREDERRGPGYPPHPPPPHRGRYFSRASQGGGGRRRTRYRGTPRPNSPAESGQHR